MTNFIKLYRSYSMDSSDDYVTDEVYIRPSNIESITTYRCEHGEWNVQIEAKRSPILKNGKTYEAESYFYFHAHPDMTEGQAKRIANVLATINDMRVLNI